MKRHSLMIGMILVFALFTAIVALNTIGLAQPVDRGEMKIASGRVILVAGPENVEPFYVPPPAEFSQLHAQTATFSIVWMSGGDCQSWPSEAKTAFQYAANIWGALLNSPVPITVNACWTDLGSSSGILGGAGPYAINANFPGAPRGNTWYPGALANALAGYDLSPTYPDIYAEFNSAFTAWYFGTGSSTPTGKYNFVSVVLHELGHGLGFISSLDRYDNTNQAWWGWGGNEPPYYPVVMDHFIQNGAGQVLIYKYPTADVTPSTALFNELTNNNVWFSGTYANAANGGSRVKLYAPAVWSEGSSISHLDYNTYKDTVNRLMVYALSAGVTVHDPGPVTKGLFRDLGWGVEQPTPTPTPTFTPTPTPLVTVVPSIGGTVQVTHETTTTIQFPPAALPCNITLTVGFTDVLNYPLNLAPVKPGLNLDARCVTDGLPVYSLTGPFTLTIAYDDADVWAIKENTLMVYYWDISQWITATQTCSPATDFDRNTALNRFGLGVCNMGRYALMGETERTFLPVVLKNGP